MTFNPYDYKTKTDVNFLSMSECPGNFSIDKRGVLQMYKAIANDEMKNFCMVERKTQYFKLFWDFDIDTKHRKLFQKFENINMPMFWMFIISKLLEVLKAFIIEKNDKTFKYIYSDRTDINHKIHVYFPNIILNSEYCLILRSELIKTLIKNNKYNLTEEDYKLIIDASVFKANGLRLLFQCKPHQKGYYKINPGLSTIKKIPKTKEEQLKLTSIRTSRFTPNVKFVNYEKFDMPLIEVEKEKSKIKEKQELTTVDPEAIKRIRETNYDMNLITKLANNLSIQRVTNYETWFQFCFLCRNYGWVDLAHEISKKAKNYDKQAVNTLLNSNAKGKLFTIGSLMYWSKKDNPKEHQKILDENDAAKILSKELEYKQTDKFEKYANEVYESDFVHSLDLDTYDTFIIKAATGTGKTEKIIEAITKLVKDKDNDAITVLASRIVLAINIYGRFQEPLHGETEVQNLKMKLYDDVEEKSKNLYKQKRLIQTPDSLIHMVKPIEKVENVEKLTDIFDTTSDNEEDETQESNRLNYPDVLFIDEIESLLNYVCTSNTLNNKRDQVFTILNEYIKNAKYVFLVDSNVTIPVCEYIKSIRQGHNINIIFNKKKTNDTKYYICVDECYFIERIEAVIKRGKRVFIGSDSKKQTEMLESTLSKYNIKIKVYNCDTDDKSRRRLKEVNKEWGKFDCIICSPTIIYGVDFNKIHFDYVFGYYTKTITASSIYQQLNRIRKIKEKEAYIYIQEFYNTNVHPMPTTIKGLEKYFFRHQEECKSEFSKLAIDKLHFQKLNTNDLFTKLYLHFKCETHRCENNFMDRLIRFLTEFGGKVYTLKGYGRNSEFLTQKEELGKEITCANNEILVKASKQMEDIQKINNKKYKTTRDRKILTAYKICKDLNLTELNHNFLNNLKHVRNVEKLTESFKYFESNETLIKDTNNNIDNSLQTFIKKRNLIESGNALFFKDGVLSTEVVNIFKHPLTEEQQKWWDDNGKDILYCFKNIRSDRVKVNNQVNLYNIIQFMNRDFFCGFVDDISNRKTKQINKKKHIYYQCSYDASRYVELLLNAKKDIPKSILEQLKGFSDIKCQYEDIHNKSTIGNLIEKHEQKIKDIEFFKKVTTKDIDFLKKVNKYENTNNNIQDTIEEILKNTYNNIQVTREEILKIVSSNWNNDTFAELEGELDFYKTQKNILNKKEMRYLKMLDYKFSMQ
jgi:hypothetical protein